MRAANDSRHRKVARYWGSMRKRRAISLASLIADAADGFVQRSGATGGEAGCQLAGAHLIHKVCLRASATRGRPRDGVPALCPREGVPAL